MAASTRSETLEPPRKAKKRQLPSVLNGVANSFEERNSDFLCPICFDMIQEAHMTKCGHSFCYECIIKALDVNPRCPKCSFPVDGKDHVFPNFSLNELITKHQVKEHDRKRSTVSLDASTSSTASELHELIESESDNLNLCEVNVMLDLLQRKKQQLEMDCRTAQIQLLREFLQHLRKNKQEQLEQITNEVAILEADIKRVDTMDVNSPILSSSASSFSEQVSQEDGFNGSKYGLQSTGVLNALSLRRKRLHTHLEDLEQCYFDTRLHRMCSDGESGGHSGLEDFTESLSKFTRYSAMRPLATLNYASDLLNGTSIVSSIEFDKDNEFFAIAGVTKKIKLFDYSSVVQDTVDIHYPINDMVCNSKISCVSWSSYHKGMLASSDYEGTVTLWDAFTGQRVRLYQEHEKRCWSVDFNRVDTKLLASGSDDTRVKLWSTNQDHSVASLEAKANVCCVKFNPDSRYHLALGSADHSVHYFDLRNTKGPLGVFKGHKKAVSYVKFLNTNELVSASTDSQLKLWNMRDPHCLRSFRGHTNEKNFVGLATDGDYVACGSENNALYVYFKGLSKNVLSFRFETPDKDRKEEESNEFVSAVCWRHNTSVVVAANSQGTIKVLELV